jgi:lipopolysaccharide heptosyltransferase II
MALKNFLIKKAVSLIRSCQSKSRTVFDDKRFLIVSTTGLGDTLWATPALKALRDTYPSAYIAVLTSPIGEEILAHNRHIDELFVVKDPPLRSLLCLYSTLRKKNIGTTLIFHTSQRPVLPFAHLITQGKVVGTEGINKGLDALLSHRLEKKEVHEIARRLEIVESVGVQILNPTLELFLSERDEREASDFLDSLMIPSYLPLIGLHPGAKDLFKQWPASHFVELGNRLVQHLGCQVLVTGGQGETALVESIASQIKDAIPLAGKLSLRPFAALVKRFSLMISNDTGPMHIAFAVETPTVALFTPTDPKLCGPYFASRARVIKKQPTCTPCLRKKCPEPFCLLQISPQEVFDACLKLLYTKDSL